MKRTVVFNDKITYESGEKGAFEHIEYEPHKHTKDDICMRIQHPDKTGLRVRLIQLNFCQGCGLAWFEELPSVSAFDVSPQAGVPKSK